MTDDELIRYFEAGDEPPGGFHHPEHVRVAWYYARRHPWPVALQRFQETLRRFAAARGKPERYHETITAAFMVLVQERLDDGARELTWDESPVAPPTLLAIRSGARGASVWCAGRCSCS